MDKLIKYRLVYVMLLFILMLSLEGCRRVQHFKWEEEIKQIDGKSVKITRIQTRYSNDYPISSEGSIISEEINYPDLGVAWKGGRGMRPASFYVIGNIAYLVVHEPQYDLFCAKHPKGSLIANFHRWSNKQMEIVSEQEVPIDKMTANLTVGGWTPMGYESLREYFLFYSNTCK